MPHPEDKETQAARPRLESPTGLDLHPKPESSPRISKRVGIIIGVAGLLILIGFAYGGYRRSVKAQATARAHGLPRTLAPAGDAEIVKGIPAGNAAVAHKPAAQPADLEPPEESGAAIPNPCVSDGRSHLVFRFNPETGQPCSAPLERVVVRGSHVQPAAVVAPPLAREPSAEEKASLAASEQEHEAMVAPTAIRSSEQTGYSSDHQSAAPAGSDLASIAQLTRSLSGGGSPESGAAIAGRGLLPQPDNDYNTQNE